MSPFRQFGLVLVAIGVGFVIAELFVRRRIHRAQAWPRSPARLLRSWVEEASGEDGTVYLPRVEYEYVLAGKRYVSGGIWAVSEQAATRQRAESAIAQLALKKRLWAHVNPANPKDALLRADWPPSFPTLWLVGLVLAFIGILVLSRGAA